MDLFLHVTSIVGWIVDELFVAGLVGGLCCGWCDLDIRFEGSVGGARRDQKLDSIFFTCGAQLQIHLSKNDTTLSYVVVSYLTIRTEQCAWLTTPEETLPTSIFLNPVNPLVPITIRSMLLLVACSRIVSTIENAYSRIRRVVFTFSASANRITSSTIVSAFFRADAKYSCNSTS